MRPIPPGPIAPTGATGATAMAICAAASVRRSGRAWSSVTAAPPLTGLATGLATGVAGKRRARRAERQATARGPAPRRYDDYRGSGETDAAFSRRVESARRQGERESISMERILAGGPVPEK